MLITILLLLTKVKRGNCILQLVFLRKILILSYLSPKFNCYEENPITTSDNRAGLWLFAGVGSRDFDGGGRHPVQLLCPDLRPVHGLLPPHADHLPGEHADRHGWRDDIGTVVLF